MGASVTLETAQWPDGSPIDDADIGVIVAYFVVILAVGIWVSKLLALLY